MSTASRQKISTDMPGHRLHSSILREYDIRGIVDETLFEADAEWIGRAFATVLARRLNRAPVIAVGRDGRLSSPAMEAALIAGLMSAGAKVRSVGVGPTPMLYFSVYHLETDGGIMVTGSHNPPTHNGFKMMIGRKPFFGAAIQDLGKMVAAGDVLSGSGTLEEVSVLEAYVARLASELADVDIGGLTVGWDAGNGAAGEAMALLTKRIGGRHVILNEAIDGTFPGPSSRPDRAQEPGAASGNGGAADARYRYCVRRRRRPDRRHRCQGPHPLGRPDTVDPGA